MRVELDLQKSKEKLNDIKTDLDLMPPLGDAPRFFKGLATKDIKVGERVDITADPRIGTTTVKPVARGNDSGPEGKA